MRDVDGEVQNVTLTLPARVLREARHLAVDRGLSLSRFLARVLEDQVQRHRAREKARELHLRLLSEGWDLGTGGRATWTRDELHER